MAPDVGEPQRLWVLDEQSEDAASARQVADRAMAIGINAAGDEALELGAALIENAERGISRAGHPARHVEQLADDALDLELGDEPAPGLDELPQAGSIERRGRSSERGLGLISGRLRHVGDGRSRGARSGLQPTTSLSSGG